MISPLPFDNKHCSFEGYVKGAKYAGGIAAVGHKISNCYVDAYVEGGSVNPIAPSIEHYTATILNTAYNTDKYKAGCTTEGVRGFTTGQFASGEVAYALNNGNNIWKQTLDGEAKDSTPTLNTSKSVKVKCSCSFTFKTSWRFTQSFVTEVAGTGILCRDKDESCRIKRRRYSWLYFTWNEIYCNFSYKE